MAAPAKPTRGTSPRRARRPTGASSGRTGAEALVARAEELGIEVAFGIPGVHNLAVFDALRRSRIRTILVRHEQTAVYAADGFGRATGRLALAVTTTGPGAANTAGAMGEARAARSPLIHVSTQIDSALLAGRGGRWSLHESPYQRELMSAVSLWSGTVALADAIPGMVTRAALEATGGRGGPAFLEIPFDLLSAEVPRDTAIPAREPSREPDAQQVARACAVLRTARRPVIWVGGGAASDPELVRALAERLDAPVVMTFSAKGVVPPDHSLCVGFPPHEPAVTKLIRSSDAIVMVGTDLDGMNTQNWRLPLPKPRISINPVAEDARRNYASDVVVESHARQGVQALLEVLETRRPGMGARRTASARTAAEADVAKEHAFRAPFSFVRAVERVLPEGTVVLADMAVAGYWLAGYFRARAPRSFQYPLGWGTLGFALPAAVGAAASGRRALVVCGDAGALYGIGELATLVQERLPVTVLVANDNGYGMLRYDERARFGEEFASDLHAPDFVALAESFGVPARRAGAREITAALRWGLSQTGPSLIELRAAWPPPVTTSPRWPLREKPEARP